MRAGKPVKPWAVYSAAVSDPADANAIPGLTEEFFAPVLTILRVSSPPAPAAASAAEPFLAHLPDFAGRGLWGNLVASVYAPPEVSGGPAAAALQTCVDDLRYGSLIVNGPTFVAFNLPVGAWGGFSGEATSLADAGSGIGKLLNTRLVDDVQKQVILFETVFTPPPAELPLPGPVTKALIAVIADGARGLVQAALP